MPYNPVVPDPNCPFVSRGGIKLDHAIAHFGATVRGLICADLGCSTGGFTDCLLQRGAIKVYAVDTGYGVLDYKLRRDPRVVVMERTNAMHVDLPEQVDLVTIDAGWTRQKHVLPNVRRMLKDGAGVPPASVITLIKPHYESDRMLLRDGILPDDRIDAAVARVKREIEEAGFEVAGVTASPIKGQKGNAEYLALLHPSPAPISA
jgi:23S rRNA (cytidine1920-2'-O)/16S rRNA (cytidine1409-2'-O)-methyltransferase